MELLVNSRNLDLTDRLRSYVEKKTERLDRYMPDLTDVRVDLSAENTRSSVNSQVAQITIRDSHGTILRAEERNGDMFAAIDSVVDKLYRQIQRYRGKRQRRWRKASKVEEFLGEPLPFDDELEEDDTTIVRYKRFGMRPMSPEEAVDQIDLLGHDFFVFFNSEENAVNVLYKRRNDSFGLLQPEMD